MTHTREPGAYAAVAAGVDCLEHGYGLTDETIALMAEKGTFYDPTIICNLSDQYIREREERLAKLGLPRTRRSSGCAPPSPMPTSDPLSMLDAPAAGAGHGLESRRQAAHRLRFHAVGEMGVLEMEQFVLSGVSEMETLIAATRNPAEMLGLDDVLGTVEAGKLADLVVVDGNPLENISNIRRVRMVFKNGVEVDLDIELGTATYWDYFGSTGPCRATSARPRTRRGSSGAPTVRERPGVARTTKGIRYEEFDAAKKGAPGAWHVPRCSAAAMSMGTPAQNETLTVLTNCNVIDATGSPPLEDATVVIDRAIASPRL